MKRCDAPFATEAELCLAFGEHMRAEGWVVYAETAGFDMLLVRPDGDPLAGVQMGVEAKLTLNSKVCEQILPPVPWSSRYDVGPDHRAIVVASIGGATGFAELLRLTGIMVFEPRRSWNVRQDRGGGCQEVWEFRDVGSNYACHWHDFNPATRSTLPEYIPSVAAGVPAPLQLTPWKIGALKVMAMLELQGFVTPADVRDCGVDARRFCASDGWLAPHTERGKWTRGSVPAFDQQHPLEYTQVLAKTREQLRKAA